MKIKFTNYNDIFEIWHNHFHIFTITKDRYFDGKVLVTYKNELTMAYREAVYKNEKSANIQIKKFENKAIKMFEQYTSYYDHTPLCDEETLLF